MIKSHEQSRHGMDLERAANSNQALDNADDNTFRL